MYGKGPSRVLFFWRLVNNKVKNGLLLSYVRKRTEHVIAEGDSSLTMLGTNFWCRMQESAATMISRISMSFGIRESKREETNEQT